MIDEKLVNRLTEEFGSPLYVFESGPFIENYMDLLSTFRAIYPKYQIAYSYKTNHVPRICQIVKELGGFAEVVSDMEYTLAKRLGYEDSKIIYNGPAKGILATEHLLGGGILNVDNMDEAYGILELANRHPDTHFSVGIRLNIDLGLTMISRFGIDSSSEDVKKVFELLGSKPNIEIAGLHCHMSRARGISAWRDRAEIMLSVVDQYFHEPPKFINLGGGMFGRMEESFATQFNTHIPSYNEYAVAILESVRQYFSNFQENDKPWVFTEPGTTLVARYVNLLSKVRTKKSIREREVAILDGSFYNLGKVSTQKNLPVTVVGLNREYHQKIDLTGYTCLEEDVMYRGYKGAISNGDVVVFENIGAYSIVSKPPFIQPNCPMVELSADGSTMLVKRQETFDDVFATYEF